MTQDRWIWVDMVNVRGLRRSKDCGFETHIVKVVSGCLIGRF